MRKVFSFVTITLLLVGLVACENKEPADVYVEETISLVEHNQLMKKQKEDYENKLKDSNMEVVQLPELNNEGGLIGELHYNEERDIYAYIDDVGFEVIGNVNLYDPKTGLSQKVTSYDYGGQDPTVKKIAWFSENQLLMIVGFASGTVTVGGSVNVLFTDTGVVEELIVPGQMQEVIDIVKPDGGSGSIIFVVAEWDENFMEYETFTIDYKYSEISRMIETK